MCRGAPPPRPATSPSTADAGSGSAPSRYNKLIRMIPRLSFSLSRGPPPRPTTSRSLLPARARRLFVTLAYLVQRLVSVPPRDLPPPRPISLCLARRRLVVITCCSVRQLAGRIPNPESRVPSPYSAVPASLFFFSAAARTFIRSRGAAFSTLTSWIMGACSRNSSLA